MILETIVIFIGGIVGGLYGASVGGGALFTLPLLLLVGLPPQLALGTQRLGAVMLELSSSIKFHTAKKLNLRLAVILSAFAVIGAVIGVNIVVSIPQDVLNIVIGILLLSAVFLSFNKDRFNLEKYHIRKDSMALLILVSILLGFYGGFFGAGFGMISVIVLSLFGFKFLEGAAIARVIGFFTALASMIIFAQHGFIDYRLGFALGIGFAIGGWIGVGMAIKKGEKYIRTLLLLVIIASLIKILFS